MLNQAKRRLKAAVACCATLGFAATLCVALVPTAAARPHPAKHKSYPVKHKQADYPAFAVPVRGTLSQAAATGTLTIQRFVKGPSREQPVSAVGTLVMQSATQTSVTRVVLPVNFQQLVKGGFTPSQLECEVLDLSLGPLDLDVLGLVIHLDEVNLDITAVPGAGNLLGNLLCAIVGLLNPFDLGDLGTLLNLLNQVLDLLG